MNFGRRIKFAHSRHWRHKSVRCQSTYSFSQNCVCKKMDEEDIATLEDLFCSFIESSEEEPNDSTEPRDSWTFAGADESRDFVLSDVAISETLLSKVKDEIETVCGSIRRRLNQAHNDDITEDDVINLCLS